MEKSNPILSIIIPSYNTFKYVEDYPNYYVEKSLLGKIEILLVDDGSTDEKTPKSLDSLCSRYPDFFRVIHKCNGGHGSTINVGVIEALGKYVKVVDGDDWLDKGVLIQFVRFLEDCDADIVATNYKKVYEGTNDIEEFFYNKGLYNKKLDFDSSCSKIDTIEFHSICYNSSFLKNVFKPLDEKCFYVDTEYILFPVIHAKTIYFYDGYLYNYRQGISEQSVSLQSLFKNRQQLIKVLFSLLSYYNDNQSFIQKQTRLFYLRRTTRIMNMSYRVLFRYPESTVSLNELKSFNDELKRRFPKQYGLCSFKFKLLRAFNFKFYWIFRKAK